MDEIKVRVGCLGKDEDQQTAAPYETVLRTGKTMRRGGEMGMVVVRGRGESKIHDVGLT